jgi:hypothetical protein
MQAYRRNIDILIENGDKELAESETIIFNEYIDMFSQFVDEEEDVLDEPISLDPDMEDSIPLDTIERVPDSTIE